MKILFVVKALNDIKGGAERVLCDVASGLAQRGHDVTVLSFDAPGGKPFYPLGKQVKRLCFDIGNPKEKATFVETLERMKVIRKTAKHEQPDVVVAFMHSAFVPAAFSLVGTGMPVIASEHTVPAYYETRKLEFFFLLVSSFFVRRVTVVSDGVKKDYPLFLRRRITTIANLVHLPEEGGIADPSGKNMARKTILSVGRLDLKKDHRTLILAFSKLADDFPDWDLRIMGDGPLREDLEKMVRETGVSQRVFLPGTTPDIGVEYQKAHIFTLPSRYESFGLATAEAMGYGLPAIGFADCPGTNELIVPEKNGLLATGPDRAQALANALKTLMTSPDLRVAYGGAGRESVRKYAPEKILDAWEFLLKNIKSGFA